MKNIFVWLKDYRALLVCLSQLIYNITILNVEIQIFQVLVLACDIATMYPYFYKPVGKSR